MVGLLLKSLTGYLLVAIVFIILMPLCFIIACLPAHVRFNSTLYYWCVYFLYLSAVKASFLTITKIYEGIIPDEPSIIVANHESALDIPFLGILLNGAPHTWLFLARYAKLPIFGFIARRMNIVVNLSSVHTMRNSLSQALKRMHHTKSHLIVFPEGGRTVDKITKFYQGFAFLAKQSKRPVVPIKVFNLGNAYPPGSFLVHSYPIRIVIGEAFFYHEGERQEAFIERVREWFINQQ